MVGEGKVEELEGLVVERGDASPEQVQEVASGKFYTIREIADELRYSYTWIVQLCQSGRINAVKPVGGRWRIPMSERNRLITEGIPPPPRVAKEEEEEEEEELITTPIIEIPVTEDKVKILKERTPEMIAKDSAKKKGGFLDFLFKD